MSPGDYERITIRTWPEGGEQYVDVFLPESSPGQRPALLCFHGGGFRTGTPESHHDLARRLTAKFNMVVASASYRLSDVAHFPAPVHDAAYALRWLRSRSIRYNLDPNRVGLLGDSAGGYLAAMAALTVGNEGLAGGTPHDAVQALVVLWGPLDFVARWYGNGGRAGAEENLLATTYDRNPALYHTASALAYVTPAAPPALLVYGNKDAVVHPQQGALTRAAWESVGVPVRLCTYDGVGHLEAHDPADEDAWRVEVERFIAKRLSPARL